MFNVLHRPFVQGIHDSGWLVPEIAGDDASGGREVVAERAGAAPVTLGRTCLMRRVMAFVIYTPLSCAIRCIALHRCHSPSVSEPCGMNLPRRGAAEDAARCIEIDSQLGSSVSVAAYRAVNDAAKQRRRVTSGLHTEISFNRVINCDTRERTRTTVCVICHNHVRIAKTCPTLAGQSSILLPEFKFRQRFISCPPSRDVLPCGQRRTTCPQNYYLQLGPAHYQATA